MSKRKYSIIACVHARGHDFREVNSYTKTHPFQAFLAKIAGQDEKQFLHAEIAAILAAGGKEINCLNIYRRDALGNYANAKPCIICQLAIKMFDIKEVYYSTPTSMKRLEHNVWDDVDISGILHNKWTRRR